MVIEIEFEERQGLSSDGALYFKEEDLGDFESADPDELLEDMGLED